MAHFSVIKYDKTQQLPVIQVDEARLEIVSGPEEGCVYRLEGDCIRLGRHSDNDIILLDLKASRFHAEFVRVHGRFLLKDLKSQNGVFVNNQQVLESEVHTGDFISIGNTVFKFVDHVERPREHEVLVGSQPNETREKWRRHMKTFVV